MQKVVAPEADKRKGEEPPKDNPDAEGEVGDPPCPRMRAEAST
jgi:hypothetical protein